MKLPYPTNADRFGEPDLSPNSSEQDLWFLPGPGDASDDDPSFFEPAATQTEGAVVADWGRAEAVSAAKLARTAYRLGTLDERLRRGPEGWRHRLALMEAAELSWFAGQRVSVDRLALWTCLRLSGAQDDPEALSQAAWAARRLTGGPGPDRGLAAFLDRRDPAHGNPAVERLGDSIDSWSGMMSEAAHLHPITRACMGYHLWSLAGLGRDGGMMEAAVSASRLAASETMTTVFAPIAMGGGGALRASGTPSVRLDRWLTGMDEALLSALRSLDAIEAWTARAKSAMTGLSGRTPRTLREVLAEWPMVSAPMAEVLTGSSRAAVQRGLNWMQGQGLVQEVTGHGRFRMWRASP